MFNTNKIIGRLCNRSRNSIKAWSLIQSSKNGYEWNSLEYKKNDLPLIEHKKGEKTGIKQISKFIVDILKNNTFYGSPVKYFYSFNVVFHKCNFLNILFVFLRASSIKKWACLFGSYLHSQHLMQHLAHKPHLTDTYLLNK